MENQWITGNSRNLELRANERSSQAHSYQRDTRARHTADRRLAGGGHICGGGENCAVRLLWGDAAGVAHADPGRGVVLRNVLPTTVRRRRRPSEIPMKNLSRGKEPDDTRDTAILTTFGITPNVGAPLSGHQFRPNPGSSRAELRSGLGPRPNSDFGNQTRR